MQKKNYFSYNLQPPAGNVEFEKKCIQLYQTLNPNSIPQKKLFKTREHIKPNRKAVTEGKSEVVAMTQRETAEKTNCQRRRKRAPVVPAIP